MVSLTGGNPVNSTVRCYLSTMTMRFLLGLILAVAVVSLGCGRADLQPDVRYSKRLAHDSKTGQYIGVVMGECKVYERNSHKETVT